MQGKREKGSQDPFEPQEETMRSRGLGEINVSPPITGDWQRRDHDKVPTRLKSLSHHHHHSFIPTLYTCLHLYIIPIFSCMFSSELLVCMSRTLVIFVVFEALSCRVSYNFSRTLTDFYISRVTVLSKDFHLLPQLTSRQTRYKSIRLNRKK